MLRARPAASCRLDAASDATDHRALRPVDARSRLASIARVTLDAWHRAGRTFVHDGRNIFYRTDGSGPALLCIHGFPTASWDWHAIWPALTARFRVIAADMLGFGFSAKPTQPVYSIAGQASLQEALLASLGVERCHVLAHDYGDTVAQELLARHDERRRTGTAGLTIDSLCLLNGGLFPEVHRARLSQKLLASPVGGLFARLTSERAFNRSFAAIFGPRTKPAPAELHDFWRLLSHDGGHRLGHRLIHYMAERRQHRSRWVDALCNTTVPLRLINGPEDPVSGRHLAEHYRANVPHPDVVLLDGIGHYPQVEDPAGVLRAFFDFIDGTAVTPPSSPDARTR